MILRKREPEHVFADVPAIIEPTVFGTVQALLKVTPPRVVTGPILLTGLAVCAACRGAMTLRTGTSKTGKVHRTTLARAVPARAGQAAGAAQSGWTSSTRS